MGTSHSPPAPTALRSTLARHERETAPREALIGDAQPVALVGYEPHALAGLASSGSASGSFNGAAAGGAGGYWGRFVSLFILSGGVAMSMSTCPPPSALRRHETHTSKYGFGALPLSCTGQDRHAVSSRPVHQAPSDLYRPDQPLTEHALHVAFIAHPVSGGLAGRALAQDRSSPPRAGRRAEPEGWPRPDRWRPTLV